MLYDRVSPVNAEVINELTYQAGVNQVCLLLVSGRGNTKRLRFLYSQGIDSRHIAVYQQGLFTKDPHMLGAEGCLKHGKEFSQAIHFEDSQSDKIINRWIKHSKTSEYRNYLFGHGIVQTAAFSKRLTPRSYLMVGLLSEQRRRLIRLDESANCIKQWIDQCAWNLLDIALEEQYFASTRKNENREHLECLSPRERQLSELIAQGFSNKQVASNLDISENTVENHLRKIYRKLGIHNRTSLVAILQGRLVSKERCH